VSTATIQGSVLDTCQVCGQRVKDFDPDGYEADTAQRGHFTCDRTGKPAPQATTYRVLDLNLRRTVQTGLTWNQAHSYIERRRAADPAARFDIRTEVAS
jgi:hypothetical protein